MFQSSDHLRDPPPDLLQQLHVLLVLEVPEYLVLDSTVSCAIKHIHVTRADGTLGLRETDPLLEWQLEAR